ncbi:MAG: pseudouridine synthase [Thermoleophilia bacterium]|nr:pseudouridine synthase [Thermoleophilia bacterium]MCZ4496863.1 pseudouridine synthase [Thermoleophilia bacterium]
MTSPQDPFLLPGDTPVEGDKLQKFMSAAGVASRRHSEVMIGQGRVTVNGVTAKLGDRVHAGDKVLVNGVEVGPQAPRLLMLNKPTGVVTTLDDPQGRRTVADLVPSDVRVYPVGRLDYDTSGLLLLTNDGDLAHRLMHPSFGVKKTYRAKVEGRISPASVRQLAQGVELEDGMTAPAEAKLLDAGDHQSLIELIIHEGRNRQVRRMCDEVGHPVIELVRVAYGPLVLGGLGLGKQRALTDPEIRRLKKFVGTAPARKKRPPVAEGVAGSEDEAIDAEGQGDAGSGGDANDQQQPNEAGKRASGHRGGGTGRRKTTATGKWDNSGSSNPSRTKGGGTSKPKPKPKGGGGGKRHGGSAGGGSGSGGGMGGRGR